MGRQQASKRKRPAAPRAHLKVVQEEARARNRLAVIRQERRALDLEETELVDELRQRRCTWEDIGKVTGRSRAGAQRKWGASTSDE